MKICASQAESDLPAPRPISVNGDGNISSTGRPVAVYAEVKTLIPARSAVQLKLTVRVPVRRAEVTGTYMLSPNSSLFDKEGVTLGHSVVTVAHGNAPTYAVNFSDHNVILNPGCLVGSLEACSVETEAAQYEGLTSEPVSWEKKPKRRIEPH